MTKHIGSELRGTTLFNIYEVVVIELALEDYINNLTFALEHHDDRLPPEDVEKTIKMIKYGSTALTKLQKMKPQDPNQN